MKKPGRLRESTQLVGYVLTSSCSLCGGGKSQPAGRRYGLRRIMGECGKSGRKFPHASSPARTTPTPSRLRTASPSGQNWRLTSPSRAIYISSLVAFAVWQFEPPTTRRWKTLAPRSFTVCPSTNGHVRPVRDRSRGIDFCHTRLAGDCPPPPCAPFAYTTTVAPRP